jgi:hypothetical protein
MTVRFNETRCEDGDSGIDEFGPGQGGTAVVDAAYRNDPACRNRDSLRTGRVVVHGDDGCCRQYHVTHAHSLASEPRGTGHIHL